MKKIIIGIAIVITLLTITCLSITFTVVNETYLIRQSDITKIETCGGMYLKIIKVENIDICDNIKAVTIEGRYYFGGNLWTTLSQELNKLGIVYYGYK